MRKITIIVMVMVFMLSSTAGAWQFVAEDTPKKPTVPIMFVNNITTDKSRHWDKFHNHMYSKTIESTQNAIGTKYNITSGEQYVKKLQEMGFVDFSLAGTSELLTAVSDSEAEQVIYIEIAPLGGEQPILIFGGYMQVTMVVKILDVKNKKYLYAGKITKQSATDAWRAFDKTLPEYETILKTHIK